MDVLYDYIMWIISANYLSYEEILDKVFLIINIIIFLKYLLSILLKKKQLSILIIFDTDHLDRYYLRYRLVIYLIVEKLYL